jgi:hypothetical protein
LLFIGGGCNGEKTNEKLPSPVYGWTTPKVEIQSRKSTQSNEAIASAISMRSLKEEGRCNIVY